jgi:flagellar hook protein FlgE
MDVLLSNDPGNTGAIDFSNNTLSTTTPGKNGDQVFTTVQIYDSRGQAQTLTAEFTKVSTDQWDARFSMTTANGTMVDDLVSGIEFNVDGTFRQINGMGTGDAAITLNFDDINGNQTVDLDFSKMSHHSANFGAFFDQDGYPTGTLQQLSVTGSGVLEAIATNGQRIAVAQLAITSFRNPQGLTSEGNNYFAASIASGLPQSGAGQMNGRGEVISGNLEQSNVDVAFEFTQLIVAQRGFSANARSVTVTDNVLQELTNIVR